MNAHADLDDLVIDAAATIRQAMETINRSGLEVALLCEGRRLQAVITDGDIRRALLAGAGMDEPVAGVGNTAFTSIGAEASRAEAVELMLQRGFKCVPVIDKAGNLVDLHSLRIALRGTRSASWAVIMAGGFGTRLGELTDTLPKPMLPIGDRPILQHLVEHCVAHGIDRIFLSVNYLGRMIEDHFGDGSRFSCRIEYLREEEPLGTGGALSLLPEAPEAPLLLMNGDLLTRINIDRLLKFHRAGEFAATMALRTHTVKVPFGVAEVDGARVSALIEKPELTYQINAGIYAIDPAEVARIPADTFFPITRLLENAMAEGRGVGAYHMQEPWVDIGNPDDFWSVQAAES